MDVTFQVSIYPIAQDEFKKPIDGFISDLKNDKIEVRVHETSTIGECEIDRAFDAIKKAYAHACSSGPTVMVLTVVNEHPSKEELKALNK